MTGKRDLEELKNSMLESWSYVLELSLIIIENMF